MLLYLSKELIINCTRAFHLSIAQGPTSSHSKGESKITSRDLDSPFCKEDLIVDIVGWALPTMATDERGYWFARSIWRAKSKILWHNLSGRTSRRLKKLPILRNEIEFSTKILNYSVKKKKVLISQLSTNIHVRREDTVMQIYYLLWMHISFILMPILLIIIKNKVFERTGMETNHSEHIYYF